MPIKIKIIVQTIGNTQLGGVSAGLVKVSYQPLLIDGVVKSEPINPATRGMAIEIKSLRLNFRFVLHEDMLLI